MELALEQRWHTVSTESPLRDAVAVRTLRDPRVASRGTVLFCHGLGMGADTYWPLQRFWAERGLTVVAPEFADSLAHLGRMLPNEVINRADPCDWMTNPTVVQHALGLMFQPEQWSGRALDAIAVLDHIDGLVPGIPGAGAGRVVVAGHSYGAHTAQLISGVRVDIDDTTRSFGHDRVTGSIVMSPQGSGERGLSRSSWNEIDIPWLVLSGENDIAAQGQGVEWRREAFDLTPEGSRHLAVALAADHGLGGIAGSAAIYDDDPVLIEAIGLLTDAFFEAALTDPALLTTDDWWPAQHADRFQRESK